MSFQLPPTHGMSSRQGELDAASDALSQASIVAKVRVFSRSRPVGGFP
jgi:hypothetical protein